MTLRASSILGGLSATLINLLIALLLGGLLVAAVGADPSAALRVVYNGAFGSSAGLSYTFYYATNYIFAGLAFAVAAQASQFNIGAEGQAYIGGLGTGLACLALPGVSWWLALPVAVAASGLFSGGWALIPAVMEARRGSNLIITTIMFNFLASLLMTFVIVNLLRVPGSAIPSSGPMPESSFLPRIDQILTAIGIPTNETPLTIMVFVAVALALGLIWLIWHTRWGYELRAIGKNSDAAAFAGVNVARVKIQAICLSGAVAGMLGVNEVMGAQHRVLLELAAGYGFTGIAVALIGANHPAGIIPAAVLFGALQQGGASLSFMFPNVSRDVVVIVQGLVILLAGGLIHMLRPRLVAFFAGLLNTERSA
ncbi:ABC transporter permease [Mesorhizobium sp. BAC0120]|uniref:ABC transporter permease n=1 Tax=Mesorhizobium sp. BAC0120 TaxID=3090670 RepID=UPI00298C2053|nr:ABC transporter permease [Mesorhizobium sp. BAC0120]MDW6021427.1 ABC transporter permease [Mesorhizobium sp. BAC0120]